MRCSSSTAARTASRRRGALRGAVRTEADHPPWIGQRRPQRRQRRPRGKQPGHRPPADASECCPSDYDGVVCVDQDSDLLELVGDHGRFVDHGLNHFRGANRVPVPSSWDRSRRAGHAPGASRKSSACPWGGRSHGLLAPWARILVSVAGGCTAMREWAAQCHEPAALTRKGRRRVVLRRNRQVRG